MTCPRPPAFLLHFSSCVTAIGLPETASNTHNTARDSPFDTTHLGVDGNCTSEHLPLKWILKPEHPVVRDQWKFGLVPLQWHGGLTAARWHSQLLTWGLILDEMS